MPSFYDKHNAPLPFTLVHVELWLRRLRILYRIDQGRYYDEVAEKILAILQFIPASLLCSVAHLTMETHSNDEAILNDLARARLFMLEEWAADGVAYRPAHLTVSYQTMSPHVLAMTAERAATKTKAIVHKEPSSVQETIPSAMGSGAFHFNFVDDDWAEKSPSTKSQTYVSSTLSHRQNYSHNSFLFLRVISQSISTYRFFISIRINKTVDVDMSALETEGYPPCLTAQ